MIRLFRVAIMMAVLIIVAGCSCQGKGCNELANKPIYADLQGIELEHRATKLTSPILLKGAIDSGKYDALGVPSESGAYPSVWIVMNINDGSGGVLAVPSDEKIVLACSYLDKLETTEKLDDAVKTYLRNSCE